MQLSLITVSLEDAQEIGNLDRDDLVKQRAAKYRKEELSREHNIKKSVNSILMHYTIIRCLDPKYVGNDQIWFIEKLKTKNQVIKYSRTQREHKDACNRTGMCRFVIKMVKKW